MNTNAEETRQELPVASVNQAYPSLEANLEASKVPVWEMPDRTVRYNNKVTEEEFLAILKENHGLFSLTARAIERKFGITFSRQAVCRRAKAYEYEVHNYKDTLLDMSRGAMYEALNQGADLKLKFRAARFLLAKLG